MIVALGGRRAAQRIVSPFSRRQSLRKGKAEPFKLSVRSLSTQEATPSRFAVVNHSEAYEHAMNGRHGKQLTLTQIDGIGKDDPPFDPFIEDELMELENDEEGDESDGSTTDSGGEDGKTRADESLDIAETELVEDDDDVSRFTSDGSLLWKKSQLAAFRAGAPGGGLFAVVQIAGSQHKVTTDDVLIVNKVKPIDTFAVGSVHTLEDVMLVSSSHLTLVGMPLVEGAQVDVMVEEITQDAKVIVFKNRRRKNSKRKNGFRRDVTMLRVLDIRMPGTYQDHVHNKRASVEEG